jgi:hypothetical protein
MTLHPLNVSGVHIDAGERTDPCGIEEVASDASAPASEVQPDSSFRSLEPGGRERRKQLPRSAPTDVQELCARTGESDPGSKAGRWQGWTFV